MIAFEEFLGALDRPTPYPWQRRFAERCAAGEPPSVIAVPTGAGKTTAVDALVWALACQAELPAPRRTVGVRIVWAIDRRILVDEVHAHACDLARRLAEARDGPLREVADRLRALAGDDAPPLAVTRWRGGIATERDLHGPLQPQVITSTVGQIASRLLFRGFGVSDRSQALAAGLAACDTTICLDEAHLVEPFRQTVEAIRAHRRREAEAQVSLPGLGLITITATPRHGEDGRRAIALDREDWARPDLKRRLTGEKWATLVERELKTERERVEALVAATLEHVRAGADSVACVVNSVRRAREVHTQLVPAVAKLDEAPELGLLIGPQRPADRAAFLDLHGPKLFARAAGEARLVCVATQTFEVGLDADVEAMVTESASATALIQRLGRLNRRGDRVGRATIVRDAGFWLYSADEQAAWDWLRARERDGRVDVSVAALTQAPEPPAAASIPAAPELSEAIVDALACPEGSLGAWQRVAVEAFWRPDEARRADVALCWRADLRPELTDAAADAYREILLELVPPQPEELLTLTINGARAVLATLDPTADRAGAAARLALAEADVEGESAAARLPEPAVRGDGVPYLVLRGDDLLKGSLEPGADDVVLPSELRPGDVIVLSARVGPVHGREVLPRTDVAADVRPAASGGLPAVEEGGVEPCPVRITPEALRVGDPRNQLKHLTWIHVAALCARTHAESSKARDTQRRKALPANLIARLRKELPDHPGLARIDAALADPRWRVSLHQLQLDPTGQPAIEPGDDEIDDDAEDAELDDAVPVPPRLTDPTDVGRDAEVVWVLVPTRTRDPERPSGEPSPPTLDAHGEAVRAQVERYLQRLDLPAAVRSALVLAAASHDHGKADPRMQAYLRRGVEQFGAEPIAKSIFGTRNPVEHRIAQRLSGLPRRWSHELPSLAVLADARASGAIAIDGVSTDVLDWSLCCAAVGNHHGRGFPLPPVPGDGARARAFHVSAAGVSGTASGDGFDGCADGTLLLDGLDVRARYGPWGAAYLEGLLRLADRVVSRRGG